MIIHWLVPSPISKGKRYVGKGSCQKEERQEILYQNGYNNDITGYPLSNVVKGGECLDVPINAKGGEC